MTRRLLNPAKPKPSAAAHVLALDAQLVARGWHPLSPWWGDAIVRFYESGCHQWVGRVGRRGGKSSSLARVAVAEALSGRHFIPPGDVGHVLFISVDRPEAGMRLRTVRAILDAIGVKYLPREGEVELVDRPIIFKIATATIAGVSGPSCIVAIADEVSKWRDADSGANPAKEVLASLRPTMATMPSARLWISSSPWSASDYHAELIGLGDTDHQRVAVAPTWEANPTITEARTHELEPDPRVWRREYAAEPSDSVTSVCSAEELAECVTSATARDRRAEVTYSALLDLGLRNDRTALVVCHRELREQQEDLADVLVVDRVVHLVPGFLSPLKLERVVEIVAASLRAYGVTKIFADAHYRDAVEPALQERGIVLEVLPMMPSAITARVESFQHRIASRRLELVDHVELRKEILAAQLEHHAGGRLTLRAPQRRGFHDDLVSALLLACDADVQRRAMPPSGGEIEVRFGPLHWSAESHTLSGVEPRYFRRQAPGGPLVPSEPPYGSGAFERWAHERIAEGTWTPSLRRWVAERGVDPKARLTPEDWDRLTSIPVLHE